MPVTNYETFDTSTDTTTTTTLLHESIPLTGTIVSGTYGTFPDEGNIKNYSHGMFQSVFDYPYLSSSANHIFDITMGYDESSALSGTLSTQNAKKINTYNQFAQILLGYTGSENQVEIFESDLSFADNDRQMKEVFFLNFSRLITKDQIKKGSFSLTINTGSWINTGTPANPFYGEMTLSDVSASETGGTNNKGAAGEYGVLFNTDSTLANTGSGLVFYQAGIIVLTASLFDRPFSGAAVPRGDFWVDVANNKRSVDQSFVSSSISGNCDALRHRIVNLSYNNTTEINSSIYFCRVPHNKFNYSANPTYTSGSKVVVKSIAADSPVSYITTIGLYNSSNELMAVAKLSEAIKKDPTNEITLRVRLDY